MKLKNNPATPIFWSIIASGFVYVLSLTLIAPKILSSALMQLFYYLQFHHLSPLLLWSNLLATLFIGTAFILFIRAIFFTLRQIIATRSFLNNLVVTRKSNFILHRSSSLQAFTAGFFRPQIYISTALLKSCSAAELQAILSHESGHQAAHDPLRHLLVDFVAYLLFPFPGKTALFERYATATEIAADFVALRHSGRLPLVSALTKVLANSVTPVALSATYFSGTQERFRVLVGEARFSLFRGIFVPFAFTALVLMATSGLSRSSLFVECKHLAECFYSLVKPVSIHHLVNNLPHCHDDQNLLQS